MGVGGGMWTDGRQYLDIFHYIYKYKPCEKVNLKNVLILEAKYKTNTSFINTTMIKFSIVLPAN